jgi:hypothetical protein
MVVQALNTLADTRGLRRMDENAVNRALHLVIIRAVRERAVRGVRTARANSAYDSPFPPLPFLHCRSLHCRSR